MAVISFPRTVVRRGPARFGKAESPRRTPLVFVPGLFETPAIWNAIRARLTDQTTFALHLPGHRPGDCPRQIETMLAKQSWLQTFADQLEEGLGSTPAHLIGHSSGGMLALQLAAAYQSRFKSLVLVGTPLAGHRDLRFNLWSSLLQDDVWGRWLFSKIWARGTASRHAFRRALKTVVSPHVASRIPSRMRHQLRACDREAIRSFAKWVLRTDASDVIKQVQCPTLQIIGRDDHVVPAKHQLRLLTEMPNARAQLVAGGHLPFLEQPEVFERVLRGWLLSCHGGPVRLISARTA